MLLSVETGVVCDDGPPKIKREEADGPARDSETLLLGSGGVLLSRFVSNTSLSLEANITVAAVSPEVVLMSDKFILDNVFVLKMWLFDTTENDEYSANGVVLMEFSKSFSREYEPLGEE